MKGLFVMKMEISRLITWGIEGLTLKRRRILIIFFLWTTQETTKDNTDKDNTTQKNFHKGQHRQGQHNTTTQHSHKQPLKKFVTTFFFPYIFYDLLYCFCCLFYYRVFILLYLPLFDDCIFLCRVRG